MIKYALISSLIVSLGLAWHAPAAAVSSGETAESEAPPVLVRVAPNYPRRAVQRRIEGYVELAFDIDNRGRPTNIEVVASEPKGVFDREVIKAVRQWRYEPIVYQGATLRMEMNFGDN